MVTNKSIKETITKIRLEKGLSQSCVADMMDISKTSYYKIEKGDIILISPRVSQLASIFGISDEEFLLGNKPNFENESRKYEEINEGYKACMLKMENMMNSRVTDLNNRIVDLEERINDKEYIIRLLYERKHYKF